MKKNSLNFFNQKINFGGHPLKIKKYFHILCENIIILFYFLLFKYPYPAIIPSINTIAIA